MEVTFGQGQQPVPKQAPVNTAAPTQAVATVPQYKTPALLSEDTVPQFTEVILPRLNMVQNLGQLKESFSPGQIIFNQSKVLYTPPHLDSKTGTVTNPGTPPLIITLLGYKPNPVDPTSYTRYAEKVVGGFGGIIVNTLDDVRAAGGTTDWAEWDLKKSAGMKRFEPVVDGLFLIERPECAVPATNPNDDPIFVYECEGKRYALAFWALRSTLYTEAHKRVFGPARVTGFLKPPHKWYSWSFALSTREKPFKNGNKSWIPIVAPNQPASPAMLEFAGSILHPSRASAAEQE